LEYDMRPRLQKYLPIFFIALLVQILAPVGLCWAAAAAASDPLVAAEICHSDGSTADHSSGQDGRHGGHDGGCSICCLATAGTFIDTPAEVALAAPYRDTVRVVWHDQTRNLAASRAGSNTQARGPPFSS
jgi:hypothetical protein